MSSVKALLLFAQNVIDELKRRLGVKSDVGVSVEPPDHIVLHPASMIVRRRGDKYFIVMTGDVLTHVSMGELYHMILHELFHIVALERGLTMIDIMIALPREIAVHELTREGMRHYLRVLNYVKELYDHRITYDLAHELLTKSELESYTYVNTISFAEHMEVITDEDRRRAGEIVKRSPREDKERIFDLLSAEALMKILLYHELKHLGLLRAYHHKFPRAISEISDVLYDVITRVMMSNVGLYSKMYTLSVIGTALITVCFPCLLLEDRVHRLLDDGALLSVFKVLEADVRNAKLIDVSPPDVDVVHADRDIVASFVSYLMTRGYERCPYADLMFH